MTQEQQHPITPSTELVQQWLCSDDFPWGPLKQTSMTITTNRLQNVATQAAQWGADQELEACVAWLDGYEREGWAAQQLRAARRPKPPSLKEQALQLLKTYNTSGVMLTADQADTIRLALEALND
jgi:hypothetical protein